MTPTDHATLMRGTAIQFFDTAPNCRGRLLPAGDGSGLSRTASGEGFALPGGALLCNTCGARIFTGPSGKVVWFERGYRIRKGV